jgi:hypothetical protein
MGLLSDILTGMLGVGVFMAGIILVVVSFIVLALSSGNIIAIIVGIILFLFGAGMIIAGRKRVH